MIGTISGVSARAIPPRGLERMNSDEQRRNRGHVGTWMPEQRVDDDAHLVESRAMERRLE